MRMIKGFKVLAAIAVIGLVMIGTHRPDAPKQDITINGFTIHQLGAQVLSTIGSEKLHAQGGSCDDYIQGIQNSGGWSWPIACEISFGNGAGVFQYGYTAYGQSGTFMCIGWGC